MAFSFRKGVASDLFFMPDGRVSHLTVSLPDGCTSVAIYDGVEWDVVAPGGLAVSRYLDGFTPNSSLLTCALLMVSLLLVSLLTVSNMTISLWLTGPIRMGSLLAVSLLAVSICDVFHPIGYVLT